MEKFKLKVSPLLVRNYCCLLLLISSSGNLVFSQNEDQKWIFNANNIDLQDSADSFWGPTVLDFDVIPPRFYRQDEILLDFQRTNTVICDKNGELLLYSNGMAIHGPNHLPVEGGDPINYGEKWEWLTWTDSPNNLSRSIGFRRTQNALIIPIPENIDTWIHLSHNYENVEASYESWPFTDPYELKLCIIEKFSENSFGLTVKDSTINDDIIKNGCLTSTRHANGRDWWLLQFNKDTVSTYIIDPTGIHLSHLQQLPFPVYESGGQAKFNQQGNAFAFYGNIGFFSEDDDAQLFYAEFDRCSGMLLNPKIHTYTFDSNSIFASGLEFSPNGNFLYINAYQKVFQLDLTEVDIFEKLTLIMEWDGFDCDDGTQDAFERWFGIQQLGQDGKIYISGNHQCFYLDVIHEPNLPGELCIAEQRAIRLPTYHYGTMPTPVSYRLGPIDGSSCDTLGINNNPVSKFSYEQDTSDLHLVKFRDLSYFNPTEWSWDFGDGAGSSDQYPSHLFSGDGVYDVCLTVSNENSSHTSCDTLNIGTTNTKDLSFTMDVSIFPNPVIDVTRVAFHNYLPTKGIIYLKNSQGQRIYSQALSQETNLDLSSLISGIYYYEIQERENVIHVGKIVKVD